MNSDTKPSEQSTIHNVSRSCGNCKWWKSFIQKKNKNVNLLMDKFPCYNPEFRNEATFGKMNINKTSTDFCERWSHDG